MKPIVVLLIHGTGASSENAEGSAWWQRKSDFYDSFQRELGGSCQVNPDFRPNRIWHWSGSNSEFARRIAGQNLADIIAGYEKEQTPYSLIGHSHGGSVIWHALVEVRNRQIKLQHLHSWATLGTPFLQFEIDRLQWLKVLTALIAMAALVATGIVLVPLYRALWTDVFYERETIPLYVTPAIAAALALICFLAIRGGITFVSAAVRQRARRTLEQRVWDEVGPCYLGLSSPDDEAINGLANTLGFRGAIIPRVKGFWSGKYWPGKILTRLATHLPLIRTVLKPLLSYDQLAVGDEFIWTQLARRAQGADLPALRLKSVSRLPVDFPSARLLPEQTVVELRATADRGAGEVLSRFRQTLGIAACSGLDVFGLQRASSEAFNWGALVHTVYFGNPDVLQFLVEHIRDPSKRPTELFDVTARVYPATPSPPRLLPWYRSAGASVMVVLLATFSMVLVMEYRDEQQLLFALMMAPFSQSASELGDDTIPFLQEVALAGHLNMALFWASGITDNSAKGKAHAGLAHSLLVAGRTNDARQVLNAAKSSVRAVGYREAGRDLPRLEVEFVHAGMESWLRATMQPLGPGERISMAIGFCEGGRLAEAANELREIPERERKFAVTVLLLRCPAISNALSPEVVAITQSADAGKPATAESDHALLALLLTLPTGAPIEILRQSIDHVEGTTNHRIGLAVLANRLAVTGNSDEALHILAVLEGELSGKPTRAAELALARAEAYAAVGLPEKAVLDLSEAAKRLGELPPLIILTRSSDNQVMRFMELACHLGRYDLAIEGLANAQNVRDETIVSIAEGFIRRYPEINKWQTALQRLPKGSVRRVLLFSALSRCLVRDSAAQLFKALQNELHVVHDYKLYSYLLSRIASEMGRRGTFWRARVASRDCLPTDRIRVLTALLQESRRRGYVVGLSSGFYKAQ